MKKKIINGKKFAPPITGIVQVIGAHDVGKTVGALGNGADPEDSIYLSDDTKDKNIVDQLSEMGRPFGFYKNMLEVYDQKVPGKLYNWIDEWIDNLENNRYHVCTIDTWNRIYEDIRNYVSENTTEFDSAKNWSKAKGSGFTFYEGKISKHARRVEEELIGRLNRKVPLVILVSHLKDNYEAEQKIGVIPESTKLIDRICNMRVWLTPNPNSPVPIMLFLKRIVTIDPKSSGILPISVTPRKAVPAEGERTFWDTIRRYQANPIGVRAPEPGETPNEYELSFLDKTLTEETKMILELALKNAAQNESESKEKDENLETVRQAVEKIKADGGTPNLLSVKKETGLHPAEISKYMKMLD